MLGKSLWDLGQPEVYRVGRVGKGVMRGIYVKLDSFEQRNASKLQHHSGSLSSMDWCRFSSAVY